MWSDRAVNGVQCNMQSGWFPVLALAGALSLPLSAGAADGAAEPGVSGRLKFRSGPVCMCSQGLSEEDIREGQQRQGGPSTGFETLKPAASENKQREEE